MPAWMYVASISSATLALAVLGSRLDAAARVSSGPITLEAEAAQLDPEWVEIVAQSTFPSGQGVVLKQDVTVRTL
jgi:hypothetical protein